MQTKNKQIHFYKAPDWLINVSRQAVRLYLLSYADKEQTNSLA